MVEIPTDRNLIESSETRNRKEVGRMEVVLYIVAGIAAAGYVALALGFAWALAGSVWDEIKGK